MKRYSAIAVFDKDLDRIVLIEKQKPAWQAGKANFPGGKVEAIDAPGAWWSIQGDCHGLDSRSGDKWVIRVDDAAIVQAHLTCAVRELAEETGLAVNPNDVKHFATLRFTTDGQPGECRFFCCVGDVDAATTKEAERVFVAPTHHVLHGRVSLNWDDDGPPSGFFDTMPNLPWLCAMARQRLRSGAGADVHIIEEA